mmetsp:Transcript_16398/g.38445  ORF Transcript_16398/g.38445 Transcript_16398/m.38445 type:complete len:131 (+) Transcript_16398:424-816(+)
MSDPEVKDRKEKKAKKEKKEKKRKAEGDDSESKAKKGSDAVTTPGNSSNQELAELFKELSSFEFKKKDRFKGVAYKKVSATLSAHPEKISCGKDARVLPGVGKESEKKIDEFLSTGKIERLEKYRRGEMD